MEVNGVAVMKRRSDSWLNATQILKVAGVEKGKRTKILEKEILTGQHEKVQGGYGRYQGTWINYQRGREFCRQYHVEELLRALLEYDMGSDGMGSSGQVDTPTKEQAMAANRKRFYNNSIDGRMNGQLAGNTFFQNISPTASNALAAMNKAARFDSPQPRPGSAQRRPPPLARQMSHQHLQSQESNYPGGSQQSVHSFASDHDMNGIVSPQYGTLGATMYGRLETNSGDVQEPPRKRVKAMGQDMYGQVDPTLQDGMMSQSQTSVAPQYYIDDGVNGPGGLPPLPSPIDKAGEEKRATLMDLFADPDNSARTDFSTHPAVATLSGEELDIPLDSVTGNNALHWAATLSRVGLMKQLIQKGANIFRGNAAGQTALMAAVQVNNTFDHGCFPEMLELLGPLIELRDATGRTVLHHIAISSGIRGRAISSRYYLESLLEFVVRQGSSSNANSQQTVFDAYSNKAKSIGLVRFMSDVVNVQDKSGNTALNLVARIGNRAIINQLDELGADYNIANYSNVRPTEFGIYPRGQNIIAQALSHQIAPSSQAKPPSQIDQIREEILASKCRLFTVQCQILTHPTAAQSILTQTCSQFTTELTKSQNLVDQQNAALRSIATQHKAEQDRLEALQSRAKDRSDRARKIANLRRSITEQQMRAQQRGSPVAGGNNGNSNSSSQDHQETSTPPSTDAHKIEYNALPSSPSPSASSDAQKAYLSSLPPASILRARLAAYSSNNAALEGKLAALKGRSLELEAQYRKVVALCTGTEEVRVEGLLESLVAAVESEDSGGQGVVDVGRVREFLRKVEGVEG